MVSRQQQQKQNKKNTMFECCICHQFARRTLSSLLRHIREVHPHFEGRVLCGVDGCPATSSSYEGLRQHMYRFHKDHIAQYSRGASNNATLTNSSDENSPLLDPEDSVEEDQEVTADIEISTSKVIGAQFILKTRDGGRLTQTATNGIVQDAKILVQNTVQTLERRVIDKVNHLGIELTDGELSELKETFHDDALDPFKGLDTEYKQEKFIRENFNYVVSKISS